MYRKDGGGFGCHSQEKNNKRLNFSHTHDELFLYLIIIVKKRNIWLVIADIFSAWSPRGAIRGESIGSLGGKEEGRETREKSFAN